MPRVREVLGFVEAYESRLGGEKKLGKGAVDHLVGIPLAPIPLQEEREGRRYRSPMPDDEDRLAGVAFGDALKGVEDAQGETIGGFPAGRCPMGVCPHAFPQALFIAELLVRQPLPFPQVILPQVRLFDDGNRSQGFGDDLGCLPGAL